MQEIAEESIHPADEQPQDITAPLQNRSASGLQANSNTKHKRSHSIAIPGRRRSGTAAQADSDFRPASTGNLSHSSARLSRRGSSGLLQGSPEVKPASAENRLYSRASPTGDGSKGLPPSSTELRPALAEGGSYSSASSGRHGSTRLLQADLATAPASGQDSFHVISISSSPPTEADQETLVSRRIPTCSDGRGMSALPVNSSLTQLEAGEEGDSQRLLTSLKSHRASSFKQREVAGLARRLQQALQACERARRHVISLALGTHACFDIKLLCTCSELPDQREVLS